MTAPQHPLAIILVATLGLPFVALMIEYIYRGTTIDNTMRGVGPDLCLLGLGSVGSVFIDPKVALAFALPPVLGGTLVCLLIFGLRGFCFRLQKRRTTAAAFGTMVLGLASIFMVGSILIVGYW